VKLGFAAAIAIPSLGLLAERATQQHAVVVPAEAPAQPAPRALDAAVAEAREPEHLTPHAEPAAPVNQPVRGAVGVTSEAKPQAREPSAGAARPSQAQFEAGEAPATSKASSTLAEETRLLDAAFAALANGNKARAAELVREHESRFPNGLLERERLRAKARLNEVFRGD
jgi:hypothetical protein